MQRKSVAADASTGRARGAVAQQQQQNHAEKEAAAMDALDDANISDDEEGGTRIGDIYIPPPVPAHCSTESKGPRLIIKCIVNQNFKSYAGKVMLGPFHHSFTAIIGPNGSGKSNVIDSMLFVFGYRANKIRCKKLSTLIHNSAKYPNMASCAVAVHFEQIEDVPGSNNCNIIEGSQIVVERTAFRDNTSFYTINGRRVQFKEVAKLLKQHSVDLDHNRFLILQGEVESIAMMRPKAQNENDCGMLEYLEDIVGTTRYIKPLQMINQRVEQLTEERTDKHNRCKMAERDMKDLEQPFNEAIEYLRQENENTRTKNFRIQKYLSELNKKLDDYTQEHKAAANELKEHDEACATLKREREQKEELIRKEIEEFEALRKRKEDIQKKLEKTRNKHTETTQTMEVINKRRHSNKKQVTKNEEELDKLQKVPEKNQRDIEECEKKVERLNVDKSKLEDELQSNYAQLEEETQPLIEKREKLETELIELKKHVNDAKSELTVKESELRILKQEETTAARKFESLKSAYEECQSSQKEKSEKLQELQTQMPEIEKEISTKQQQLDKLTKDEQNLSSTLRRLKGEINERVVNMQRQRSNNKVVDFLMRMKDEGKLPGILGRLGNLGGIDAKYDIAISTACGRLDNIVVDTVNTAQKCIDYLKRFNIGRGNFIALEKVDYLKNHSGTINTPENVPRLYDLVSVEDERVLPAFYFALRDTLVSENLDQGTRIAYGRQRYRVVTLGGEIIETSGTMSGGGGRPIRGKMGTQVQTKTRQSMDNSQITQTALEDMQMQATELQTKMNYCQEEQGRLEREINQLQAKRQQHVSDIQRFCITIKSLEQQLPSSYKQMEAQKQRMLSKTTDAAKVHQFEEQIKRAEQTFDESEKAAEKVSKKIEEIKTQIDGIHGDKVKSVQTKINGVTNQIKKLNANISKLKVEVTTSERNIVKLEKETENLRADILKAQEELRTLNEQHKQFLQHIAELEENVEEAQKTIERTRSESSGIQKEVLELQKLESDNKLKRVEIEQKVQTVASKMNEVKGNIPHWKAKLKPLRLNEIPGETEPQEPLKTYTEEELAKYTMADIQYKESVQEEQLKKKPNLGCIQEYTNKRDLYLERVKVLEDITSKRNEMRDKYEEVRKRRYTEFMDGFHVITRKLKEMYQMITQGGDAELELVDSMDPFTEGVSFSVRPPKKTWKNISNLSGGEKTLSSLALVFALHYYKPSPLYFMDEIDAALDFKNVSIVGHYIKERTKNAQFIIVSLRSNMFELSNYLVGIYKTFDCTNSVCVINRQDHSQNTQTQQTQLQQTHVENQENAPPPSSDSLDSDDEFLAPAVQPQQRETTFAPPLSQGRETDAYTTANERETVFAQSLASGRETINGPALSQSRQTAFGPHFSQGRDTTFAPSSESTTLAQCIQSEMSGNGTSAVSTDACFKKPPPPSVRT